MFKRLLILGLAVAISAQTADAARRKLTVKDQYELGLKYLKRGYYVKALEQFNRIRNYHRDDPYAVKAELAIADVYFKKSEWDQARMAYEDFMRMHPRHPDLDYVVYQMGLSLYKKAPKWSERDQTWSRQAVNTWSGFDSRFPESTYQDDVSALLTECRERLARKELLIARFYERRSAWRAVEGRADGLVDSYPNSEYLAEGLTLLAWAHAGQGDIAQAEKAIARLREQDEAAARKAEARVPHLAATAED